MVKFIADRIEKARETGIEEGRAKYSAYFINTNIYARYRADVDAKLLADDCGDCIVTEVTDDGEQ